MLHLSFHKRLSFIRPGVQFQVLPLDVWLDLLGNNNIVGCVGYSFLTSDGVICARLRSLWLSNVRDLAVKTCGVTVTKQNHIHIENLICSKLVNR